MATRHGLRHINTVKSKGRELKKVLENCTDAKTKNQILPKEEYTEVKNIDAIIKKLQQNCISFRLYFLSFFII